jgi:hypothetical protein
LRRISCEFSDSDGDLFGAGNLKDGRISENLLFCVSGSERSRKIIGVLLIAQSGMSILGSLSFVCGLGTRSVFSNRRSGVFVIKKNVMIGFAEKFSQSFAEN